LQTTHAESGEPHVVRAQPISPNRRACKRRGHHGKEGEEGKEGKEDQKKEVRLLARAAIPPEQSAALFWEKSPCQS
jgi:hypothetical protein